MKIGYKVISKGKFEGIEGTVISMSKGESQQDRGIIEVYITKITIPENHLSVRIGDIWVFSYYGWEDSLDIIDQGKYMLESKIYICNLCGESCSLGKGEYIDYKGGLIDAIVTGGYESTPGNGYGALDDLRSYKFSLCEFCLDHLFSKFKIPVTVMDGVTLEYMDFKPAAQRIVEDDWRTWKQLFGEEQSRRAKLRNI